MYSATVILLVAFAVLTWIKAAVETVDPTLLAPEVQLIWAGISYIFLTSSVAPLFTFIRNIYGFAENKLGANEETRGQINYEANQLWGTWIKYEGYIKGIGILVLAFTQGTQLEPYAIYIAGTLTLVIDLIRKSLSDIAEASA
jgi:hypothetical protein